MERHFALAKEAGATILSGPEDTFYGDRRYGAADLEGHHWYFAEKIRPMAPEDWRPSQDDLKGTAEIAPPNGPTLTCATDHDARHQTPPNIELANRAVGSAAPVGRRSMGG
jgi:hypothetical protein